MVYPDERISKYFVKRPEFTGCPYCHENTYKLNKDTQEYHCTKCGYSANKRSTENVDMD